MPLSIFTKLYKRLPVPVLVAGTRPGCPLAHVNDAARLLLGLSGGGEERFPLDRLLRPEAGAPLDEMLAKLPAGERAGVTLLARGGEERAAALSVERIELMGQDYAVVSLFVRDTRREIHEIIAANTKSLIAVSSLDSSHRILYANEPLAEAKGKTAAEVVGMPCWKALRYGKDGPCEPCYVRRLAEEGGEGAARECVWEFHDTHRGKWYLMRDAIIKWLDGRDAHLQIATDITSQKKYERELEQSASIDFMTGVYNREWGYKLMQEILTSAQYQQQTLSLCFIDLDGLKSTNDAYGHSAGDDMILTVTGVIRRSIRKSDVMFRWGGDEFVILLRCDVVIATRVIESIQSELELLNLNGSRPYTLSFSSGIVDFSGADKNSLDAVIAEADKIMYAEKLSKQQG